MKIAAVDLRETTDETARPGHAGPEPVEMLSDALGARHDVTVYRRQGSTDGGPGGSRGGKEDRTAGGAASVHHLRVGPPERIGDDALLRLMPDLGGALSALWQDGPPDVVHAYDWISGMAALAATRDTAIPVVASFDSLAVVDARHRSPSPHLATRTRLERAIAQAARHTMASSAAQALELVRLGVDRRKVSVVPCGVDLDHFSPDGPVATRTDRPRVLHLGRLEAAGGVDDVVLALRKTPGVELVVAGGPEPGLLDGDQDAQRVLALARSAGVGDRVHVRGYVPHAQVPELIRSADLLVTVPHDEPFGRVALEAMACGTPVVASGVGGLADSVVDGTCGLLVPPREPDALAYALRRILRDPVRREGFGVAGVDRANVRYSWERVAQDTAGVYLRVARPEQPRPTVPQQMSGDDDVVGDESVDVEV